jgi:hypothetical protein
MCFDELISLADVAKAKTLVGFCHVPDVYLLRLRDINSPLQQFIPYWERKNAYIREFNIKITNAESYGRAL